MKPDIVVDVGNSRIKWGWCDGDRVVRVSTFGDESAEWDNEIGTTPGSRHWAIASVHPERLDRFNRWVQQRGDLATVLKSHRDVPISVNVQNPESVGIDRLCNSLAAIHLYGPGPLIVVQVGTAVVLNLISDAGVFEGGAILPGFHLMAKSLGTGTAKLPVIQFDGPVPPEPGRTTEAAIRSGIYWSIVGAINGLRAAYGVFENRELPVVLTGGDANLIFDQINPPVHHEATLTLEGIRIAAEALP